MTWTRIAGVNGRAVPVLVEPVVVGPYDDDNDAMDSGIGYVAIAKGCTAPVGYGGSIEEAVDACAEKLRQTPRYLYE